MTFFFWDGECGCLQTIFADWIPWTQEWKEVLVSFLFEIFSGREI